MAYLDDKIPQAYKLSSDALKGQKLDIEAFIVASLIRLMGADKVDLVPESEIDEMTDASKDLFVAYMRNRTDDNLRGYMMQVHQIISELYHTVNKEQRLIIKNSIANLINIG